MKVVLKKVDSTLEGVMASEFDTSRSGRVGARAFSETSSIRKGGEAVVSEFDLSRSGRVGRMLSDTSRSGRMGRMLSDASLGERPGRMGSNSSIVSDTSKSGKAVAAGAGAVAGLFAPKLGGLKEAEEGANEAAAAGAADNQV